MAHSPRLAPAAPAAQSEAEGIVQTTRPMMCPSADCRAVWAAIAEAMASEEADGEALEAVENLLESYFVRIDGTFDKLEAIGADRFRPGSVSLSPVVRRSDTPGGSESHALSRTVCCVGDAPRYVGSLTLQRTQEH